MKDNSINRLDVKARKLILNKDNIKNFVKLSNRRQLRTGVINKLIKLLEKGNHFETPLVTNFVNGKHRLLDGNHRIESIEKYLGNHNKRKVECWVMYYEDLTEEEEKKEYTKWNSGTKQNANDFIKQYWDECPIVNKIKKVNVTPNWGSQSIEFKALISAYLSYSPTSKYNGSYQFGGTMALIEKCKELGNDDAKIIDAFMVEYQQVFGLPDRKNLHYRKPIFSGLFNIWLQNYSNFSPVEMRKSFTKVRGHERVVYYSTMSSTKEICMVARDDLLRVRNSHRSKN